MSAARFERIEATRDAPDVVLDVFERTIDRTIWTVASRGRASIALVLQEDPRVRGGVVALPSERGTDITLFAEDMQLPAGFPAEFPIGLRVHAMDGGELVRGVHHLRWDVDEGFNDDGATFIAAFAQALDDAGWQVMTERSVGRTTSLTCRSRARPEISCRVAVRPTNLRPFTRFVSVADVWVGPGAETRR